MHVALDESFALLVLGVSELLFETFELHFLVLQLLPRDLLHFVHLRLHAIDFPFQTLHSLAESDDR